MTNYLTSVGAQQFSITIASGSTTGTATINAVGSGAFILFGGQYPSSLNNPAEIFASLTLTNSTTITATRSTAASATLTINGSILDGTTALINSVQYGSVSIAAGAASGTASISAVTNNNAAVHLLGWQSANTTFSGVNEYPQLTLSGTTVTASVSDGTTGSGLAVGFAVIEFQGAALNQSVQNIAATSSSSVTSYTSSIRSVVTDNTMCIYAGSNIAAVTTNVSAIKQYGSLTSSTVFTVNVNTAIANAKTYNCSIVEFISGLLYSPVQRGTTTLSANATTTALGIIVNPSSAVGISWLGNTTTATSTSTMQCEGSVSLKATSRTSIDTQYGLIGTSSPYTEMIPSINQGGDLAVVVIGGSPYTATIASITDDQGQTWSQVPGSRATDSVGNSFGDIWYTPNAVAGTGNTTGITITAPGITALQGQFWCLKSIIASSPVDFGANVNNGASTISAVSAPVTTTNANDAIVVGFFGSGLPNPSSLSSGYTLGNRAGFQPTSGLVSGDTCRATFTSAVTYCAPTAAFLAANNNLTISRHTGTSSIIGSWEIVPFAAASSSPNIDPLWFGMTF